MPSHPTFPRDLSPIDAVASELASWPTLSEMLGHPLPAWLDDWELWERVWTRIVCDTHTHCWVWTAARNADGHGEIKIGSVNTAPYRVMYEWLVGPIAWPLVLDHLCSNRACVNPAHLEPVTNEENIMRGHGAAATNARKTHCPQGHPYDEANTIHLRNGGRRCRTCSEGYYMAHREQMRETRNAAYRAKAESLGRDVLPPSGNRTHCRRGHEYTPENTYVTLQGHRQCRECNRIADRKRYPARAEGMKQRVREWKRKHKETQ